MVLNLQSNAVSITVLMELIGDLYHKVLNVVHGFAVKQVKHWQQRARIAKIASRLNPGGIAHYAQHENIIPSTVSWVANHRYFLEDIMQLNCFVKSS